MDKNSAPLLQICFCFLFNERPFIFSLSHENQANTTEVLNSTSRYLDNIKLDGFLEQNCGFSGIITCSIIIIIIITGILWFHRLVTVFCK